MTDKQRFLVYTHLAGLLASIRKNNKISISEAVKLMLSNGMIQKLEDLETGYYLESDAYLERALSYERETAREQIFSTNVNGENYV